jgi:regulator of replication initiation timing
MDRLKRSQDLESDLMAAEAEIERLKAELFTMRNVFHQQDAENERLRDALERIRQYEDGGALAFIQIQRIVDEALRDGMI